MKRFAIPLAVAGIVGASIAAVPNRFSSAPDTDANYTEPSALATVNPCNNDAVALVGELHFLIHTTTSGSGNISGTYSFNGRYSGIGVPSGLSYTGSNDYSDTFEIGNGSAFVDHISQDFSLVSQTGQDNYRLRVQFKITINANGVPTAEVTDQSSECYG